MVPHCCLLSWIILQELKVIRMLRVVLDLIRVHLVKEVLALALISIGRLCC